LSVLYSSVQSYNKYKDISPILHEAIVDHSKALIVCMEYVHMILSGLLEQ